MIIIFDIINNLDIVILIALFVKWFFEVTHFVINEILLRFDTGRMTTTEVIAVIITLIGFEFGISIMILYLTYHPLLRFLVLCFLVGMIDI